jgi:hypothetical protein
MQESSARLAIAPRLRVRQAEIVGEIGVRVASMPGSPSQDGEYMLGLQAAVSAAVDHGLTALETGDERPLPTPDPIVAQARLAARVGVPLDTVLRRYFGGYTLLLDFIVAEARSSGAVDGEALQYLLRGQGLVHDRVVAAVSEVYAREPKPRLESVAQRRTAIVRGLLDGELLDIRPLRYQLEGSHHHGLLAVGPSGGDALRLLAGGVGCTSLIVRDAPDTYWGWLADRSPLPTEELADRARRLPPVADGSLTVAFGEPGDGLLGWRLTHRQARAAMAVARHRALRVTRYVEVALTATLLHDDLLADSLRSIYLQPLSTDGVDPDLAIRVLRAFFAADRNISSAASALDMNRQTVTKRLQAIDELLGGALHARAPDLELALLVDEL